MDNQNNSNSPNNSDPASPFGPPFPPPANPNFPSSQPPADFGGHSSFDPGQPAPSSTEPVWPPPTQPAAAADNWSMPAPIQPAPAEPQPASPSLEMSSSPAPIFPQNPTQPPQNPSPFTPDSITPTSDWTPPVQSSSVPQDPYSFPPSPNQTNFPSQPDQWPSPAPAAQLQTDPLPSWSPSPLPDPAQPSPAMPDAGTSSVNPWPTPAPASASEPVLPSTDNSIPQPGNEPASSVFPPTPTFMPSSVPQPAQTPFPPAPSVFPDAQNPVQPGWTNTDSAPTDLSHLITTPTPEQQQQSAQINSDTVVVPPVAPASDTPLHAENHGKIPLWLIGIGIGLLILVGGASAYFILGIGQPSKPTTSLPATTVAEVNEVKTPTPVVASSSAQATPVASGSANFGSLEGNTNKTQATSAAELLRRRNNP